MSSLVLNEKRTMSIMEGINHGVVNVSSHVNSLGISVQRFNVQLKKIALNHPELYNKYMEKKELNLEQFKESRKEILLVVEDMINNGVLLDDGSVRNFDILDWYYIYNRYFQKLTRIFMTELLNEIDKSEGRLRVNSRRLLSSSYNDNLGSTYRRINADYILNDNTFNLTDIEKLAIVSYFNQNGIPYNYDTYYCAAKRVVENRNNECINNNYNNEHCFDFVQNDIEKFNQLNEISKCFKINKRIR